jgi:hypothetical protein
MDAMQQPARPPFAHRARVQTDRAEVLRPHQTMLTSGDLSDPRVG